jgi:hypothetical protein
VSDIYRPEEGEIYWGYEFCVVAEALRDHGVDPSVATSPRFALHEDKKRPAWDAGDFHEKARELLLPLSGFVLRNVVPHLEEFEGVWHPSRIAQWPLGVHPDLGLLRLHCYPIGFEEMREPRGLGPLRGIYDGAFDYLFAGDEELYDGGIHDHGQRITSFNYTGYQDNIYEACGWFFPEPSDGNIAAHGLLRQYMLKYEKDGAVSMTGEYLMRPTLVAHREIEPGAFHDIDAHDLHEPTMSSYQFAATLFFGSHRVIYTDIWSEEQREESQQPVFFMAGQPHRQIRKRPVIKSEQAKIIIGQFADAGLVAA